MEEKRIKIDKSQNVEILIKAMFDRQKQTVLMLWALLWSLAGIGIITQFFAPHPDGFITYLIVWVAFWIYFEYKVIYAVRWRKYGQERILLKDEILYISREISGRAIPGKYEIDFIKNLRIRDVKENNLIYALSKAYWNPGDERIMFNYKGKEIYFGMELNDDEVKKIIKSLSGELEKRRS